MKLVETVTASEWIDGSGFLYEDNVVSVKEIEDDVIFINDNDFVPDNFDWSDYQSYYSSPLLKGTDLYLSVIFSVGDCVVFSTSEWSSVLQSSYLGV